MANTKITRRSFLKKAGMTTLGAGAVFYGPWKHNRVYASQTDKPILIGLTSDASGQYANAGASERRGMIMAMGEFNAKGGVLGRKIQYIHMDTETNPATGSRVTEHMITRNAVSFLIGAVSSQVANAVSQVAQKYGVIYLDSNSSSPTESGQNCHRVKFVWNGNRTNFAKATVKNAIDTFGRNWLLLTSDHVWGHNTSKTTRTLADAYGAKIIDELLVPQDTRDFTSYLIKIQQAKPDVVAAAVGDENQKVMREQIVQLGMGQKPAWISNQQDWPDVYGLPLDNLFGVFGTTWYYGLNLPGVERFVRRYRQTFSLTAMEVPGNVFYNGYMSTRELLKAVERAGTTNNIKVIKELELLKVSARDRMQHFDAYMGPNHQLQQTIYLAAANDAAKWKENKNDLFKMLSHIGPKEVEDTDAMGACIMESHTDTPTYET